MDIHYICMDCANELKGEWQEGHCATMHEDKCDRCNKMAALAHVADWDWPDKKTKPKMAKKFYRD